MADVHDHQALVVDSPAALEEVLTEHPDYDVQLESLNQWQLSWRRFKRHRMALLGASLFLTMVAVGIIGPIVMPFDKNALVPLDQVVNNGRPPMIYPYFHPFGETQQLQYDVFDARRERHRAVAAHQRRGDRDLHDHRHDRWRDLRLRRRLLDTILMRIGGRAPGVAADLPDPDRFGVPRLGQLVHRDADLRPARLAADLAAGPKRHPEPARGGLRRCGPRRRRREDAHHLPAPAAERHVPDHRVRHA